MKKVVLFLSVVAVFLYASTTPLPDNSLQATPMATPDTVLYSSVLQPKIEKYFKDLVQHSRFNGAMLVAHHGKIIFRGSAGRRQQGTNDQVRADHIFQLASVSKQFTSMAVVLLKQRGLIDYHKPVQQYIPEFPFADITVHHLLSHRTGLQNYMYFAETLTDRSTPLSNEAMLQLLVQHPQRLKPYWAAGKGFNYSNTGYAILALLVERVSGVSFGEFLRSNFFEPAGMRSTYVATDSLPWQRVAPGHFPNGGLMPDFYQNPIVGDKSAFSTVDDLYRWDRFLASGQVVDTLELDTAIVNHSPTRNRLRGYGYGWRLWFYPDGRTIHYHTGWYRGYTALFVRIPATESTIIFLSNRVNRSFMRNYHHLVDLLTLEDASPLPPTDFGAEEGDEASVDDGR